MVKVRLPSIFWHRDDQWSDGLNFSSVPTVSQEEYDKLESIDWDQDELITIRVRSQNGISGYVEQKSVLCRSPVLAEYFNSRHYAPQAGMTLWFVAEHSRVFSIALDFLLNQSEFVLPSLANYTTQWQIWIKVKLYFLGKRLRVPELEEVAWIMLQVHAATMSVEDIVDCARIIYSKPGERDERIRGFLQRHVERNMRDLLANPNWRELLREARSSLAADMYELTATLLLEGVSTPYPPMLPQQRCPKTQFETVHDNELSAVVVRNYSPIHVGDLSLVRGEFLQIIEIESNWVHGLNAKGDRGYFLKDYVLFYRSDQYEEGQRTPVRVSRQVHTTRSLEMEFLGPASGPPSRRDKAQSILGINSTLKLDLSKLSPGLSSPKSPTGSIRRHLRQLEAVVSPRKSPMQFGPRS